MPWKFTLMYDLSESAIADDLRKSPQISRVILWERFDDPPTKAMPDPVAKSLGADWRPTAENVFPCRVHWNWQELYTLRRREYVRQGSKR